MPDPNKNLMTIFGDALERTDPAKRAAFLDAACEGNDALRRRVEALLAAHDGAGRFLELDSADSQGTTAPGHEEANRTTAPETRPSSEMVTGEHRPGGTITELADTRPAASPDGLVAERVIAGRYSLLDVLGEGGMGVVYRANQTEPIKRQVALKLIRVGMDSRAVLARFDAERQALALMDHPNIARVYDGGTTEAGQPFFVMELVDGLPITEYCDKKRLTVKARLELFVAVCQAVQHAHQKGIIHRDLKPSNVLVTGVDGRPTPKVIDFGVAKAVEFKLTDHSFADTGAIVGTPTYMSPEQADPTSMDIDTRTDIYALGVILYELLAGSPPIDAKQFKRGAYLEMLRMVREVDPPRPSTKVSTAEALPSIAASRDIEPDQLKRSLRGDLDWISMKALEKDRTRRYETANGLAADVLRHLASEPVLAAPPSRAYRMRKLVRKNRAAVATAALVLLSLLGGIAGTTWQAMRAESARAEEAKRVAERDNALTRERARVRERDEALDRESQRVEERDAAVKVADARSDDLRYRLGVSEFLLASAAYNDRDVALAAARLENVPQKQRGWEWHYLKRLTRGGLFTLYGHTGAVNSVSYSPDGTQIVTGSSDKTTKVWDARTGMHLMELRGQNGVVSSVSFSPDGTRIVAGGGTSKYASGEAKVWDAGTGSLLLDLLGHKGHITRVAFSPDGTRIVTCGLQETKVWDALTGRPLLELEGHSRPVQGAAFSPDGKQIITGGWDGTARIWDAKAGSSLLEIRGGIGWLGAVSFSPDGSRIIARSTDRIKVWDSYARKTLLDVKVSTSQLGRSASLSPDGTKIATDSDDGTARIWDARTGALMLELRGHTSPVLSVSFSRDAAQLVTGSTDHTAKVWDARIGTPVLQLVGHTGTVNSASFSPDGIRIVTGSDDKSAKVWNALTGSPLLELRGHASAVNSVSFSPDGSRIVTGSQDRTAKVWDARKGTSLLDLTGHKSAVTKASFSPSGAAIVTSGGPFSSTPGEAKVWDARTGSLLLDLDAGPSGTRSVAYSGDGTRIATAGWRGATVWEARTGIRLLDLKGHGGAVHCVSFSQDGKRIVTCSEDTMAKVWDADSGTCLLDLKGHRGPVWSSAFNPDGTRIVTGGWDGTTKVWDARTGTPLIDLHRADGYPVSTVAFSPDGLRILASSYDRTVRVADAMPEMRYSVLRGHVSLVLGGTFSPDGTLIATWSIDNTAKLWSVRTWTPFLDLRGHTGAVKCAAFSPAGRIFVTGSDDLTAKVWDLSTGMLIFDLDGHTNPVDSVAFSEDGMRIVTRSTDGVVRVWDALTGSKLSGKVIPPIKQQSPISPDLRLIIRPAGVLVEVLPLKPDATERAYRLLHSPPNIRRYQQEYDAAHVVKDDFAAQFYLKLLPSSERMRLEAEAIVTPLFGNLHLRDDVLAALASQPAADPDLQAACVKAAETWPESASECNDAAWALVREPGQAYGNYHRGLRLAKGACRLESGSGSLLNTLGVAQYRNSLFADAAATLARSNELNGRKEPGDLAFLALAQHRLGQFENAQKTLGRLREVMKGPQRSEDAEARAFFQEAETIELDRAFPTDPFAR